MNQEPNKVPSRPRRKSDFGIYFIIIIIIIGIYFMYNNLTTVRPKEYNYHELLTDIKADKIITIKSQPVGGENLGMFFVTGTFKNGEEVLNFQITVADFQLAEIVKTVEGTATIYQANIKPSNLWLDIILTFVPFILFAFILFFIIRNSTNGNNKAFDFGRSRARLSRDKNITFKNVAGCDEEKAELEELIDFLKNPRKYVEIGARIPKGVLMVGPPGTGKTLLAKAVAGEANVPFFSISGSDFVEMFVGVGASRVRDLFKNAKENAPCIIFIDEIDAVGRQRGAGLGGGHDEREQTLNQLLVEMDGFSPNSGIIMMAATNRPDVLDPALLRPGRFDRQITINIPDVNGREAILKVHARNKHLHGEVKFDEIAQRIPGFTGADIENLLNEAALLAARDNRKEIETGDIDEAVDRVLMGPAKRTRKITEKERTTIAHHEAGHAVIGIKLDNSNIVQKVTIIPRGRAGGYALMLPEEETYLETRSSLLDRITGYLAGRVAEELIFNEVSTGAHNDFQQATKIARAMVTEYGMSKLGPIQYETDNGGVFLGRDYLKEKNFSDQIALEIDKEVRDIIQECYNRCLTILTDNRVLLETIAKYLLAVETLTRSDINEIVETNQLKRYDQKVND